jgi:predicted O-linked N-acetylglucosamine transferase (SPINDLY family)
MQILAAVPSSVLWLLDSTPETSDLMRQMAAAAGVAPERLCFAPKRPNPQHLARYPLADLFLDTFPYGAHTTAADSMWMGTPVLTLEGRGFAARVCAGLVKSAGLAELVCTSLDEYVARAIAIAQTPGIAGELRKRLVNNRDAAALFDTPRLVKGLEGLYDRMWEEFRTGELPVPNLTNLASYAEIGLGLIQGHEGQSIDPEAYAAEIARWNQYEPLAPDHRLLPRPGSGNVLPLKRAAA